jgi:hypothetical protein
MAKKQKPEAAVQRACLDHLEEKQILHFRMNSGAFKNAKGNLYFFGTPGMADILAFMSGIDPDIASEPVWIECKAPKGKQSKSQQEFERRVVAAGHEYYLVRSLEELQEALSGE